MANNNNSNARRGSSLLEVVLIVACIGLAFLLAVPIFNSFNFSASPRQGQDEKNSTGKNTSKEVLQEVQPVILEAPEE
tara:strand:- start:2135 stop:2368 length:234 start_codon:yes stop_codon:yes gene_type:complete